VESGTENPLEPSTTYVHTGPSAANASVQYDDELSVKFYALPNELVDPGISGTFQHPQDAPVSTDYMYDAQVILNTSLNAYDNFPSYWTHTPGVFDSHDVSAATIQAPSVVSFTSDVLYAQALPHYQPSGFTSPVTADTTQSAVTNSPACPHGCEATIGRPSEYRRHMTKHQGRSFNCTQPGCIKSFNRRDKLRDRLDRPTRSLNPEGLVRLQLPGYRMLSHQAVLAKCEGSSHRLCNRRSHPLLSQSGCSRCLFLVVCLAVITDFSLSCLVPYHCPY
jgi:hypothetical protein